MTHKIGEMFMLGFRTPEIPEWLHSFASEFGLGGVILFDYDVTTKKYERNIFDKAQVKKLCKEIYALPSRPLIYVDQEGGKVRRLKDKYGFGPLPSAKQMGTMSKADRLAALKPAYAEMKEVRDRRQSRAGDRFGFQSHQPRYWLRREKLFSRRESGRRVREANRGSGERQWHSALLEAFPGNGSGPRQSARRSDGSFQIHLRRPGEYFQNFVADGADGAFQSRFGQSVGKEHAGVSL